MKFKNISKNTLFVEDIDLHIPFLNGKVQEINSDSLKRSPGIVDLFLARLLEIVDFDPEERIEASIFNKVKNTKISKEKNPQSFTETISDSIEVNLHGLFYDVSGYAKVNRNLALQLSKKGIKIKIDPKKSNNQLQQKDIELIKPLESTPISRNHIRIDSVIPTFTEMYSGLYRVLYTTIESYTVPSQFIECCKLYDEIWVNSVWAKEILSKFIDKPIFVVISGVDPAIYTDSGSSFDLSGQCNNFIFLSLFAWGYRKGWDVLLKSYFQEFSDKDDVTLLISSRYQGGISVNSKDKIAADINGIMSQFESKSLPQLVRYGELLSEEQMPMLYRACDAFILTSRGESVGLPALEASLCGLPVIMTNCSGQQGYLRKDNAFLIDIDRLEPLPVGRSNIHFWDGQIFPAFQDDSVIKQIGKQMRNVYEKHKEAKKRNKKLQKKILNEFTWEVGANQAIERLCIIKKKLRGN